MEPLSAAVTLASGEAPQGLHLAQAGAAAQPTHCCPLAAPAAAELLPLALVLVMEQQSPTALRNAGLTSRNSFHPTTDTVEGILVNAALS